MKLYVIVALPWLCLAGCAHPPEAKTAAATRPSAAALPKVGEATHINAELGVRAVAPDSYVVTHEPFYFSNVLVVRMPDGTVVVCSSPFETEAARALVAWIRAALAPRQIVAINTHFHLDGTAGNEAYRSAGVVIYASDHTQQLLAERGQRHLESAAAELSDADQRRRVLAIKVTAAEKTFVEKEGLTLSFGGETVRVIYPGPAHAPDNLLVHFPSRSLLFGGCMVKSAHSIGNVADADLDHWEAAVDVARALGPRIVIPGHGKVSGPDLLDLTASVVQEARQKR